MSPSADSASSVIYRAPWLVPVTSPVIADGAVVVQGKRIRAVGSWRDICSNYSGLPTHNCPGVLLPGLVNGHTHLELSVFGTVAPGSESSTMCDWIRVLLQKRMGCTFSEEEIVRMAATAAQEQYASGVVLLLDTGNRPLPAFTERAPEIQFLLEMLGPSQEATSTAIEALDTLPEAIHITGHAPYSTSPELLQSIKNRCRLQETVFSLHVAENPDESLLLFEGKGCFYEFLKERGALDGTFPLAEERGGSVIEYLHTLGILDTHTVCVHCVHVSSDEIKLLAQAKSHVCLCPGSNRFLGVGRAPLEQFLEHAILPALGTDSIASNPVLDLWREMALLRREYPDVAAEDVLSMATLGGARALHRDTDYGSLECGRSADFLHVQDERFDRLRGPEHLLDMLTSMGRPDSIEHTPL